MNKSAREMVAALKSIGMTQQRISDAVGGSRSEVSRWQNGKAVPGGEAMLRLVELYRVKVG